MRVVLVIGALMISSLAVADDAKTADEKFEAASKLRDEGKPQEACAMFDESLKLNPNAIGTILNVARCAEEAGKVATAIRYFSDARDRAREQNLTPQLTAAEEYLQKLYPRQSHLAITFAEHQPTEGKLVVAGRVVDPASATDILVDPGSTEVVVSAPGRVPFSTHVVVPEGQHKTLEVPKLGLPVTACPSCRTIGKVGVGVGGAAVVVSIAIGGFYAHAKWNDATKDCIGTGADRQCAQDKVNSANDARTLGNVFTVVGIAGAVFAVGGAALWYFSPHAPESSGEHLAIVPIVSPTEAGLAAFARF